MNEAAGTKSPEYYWEQEKQLFAIRRFFYEQNLLPENDSYFPDDVINTVKSLQAKIEQLKDEAKQKEMPDGK